MRYFLNNSLAVPVEWEHSAIEFIPVGMFAGQLRGIIRTEDENLVNHLLKFSHIREITEEEFVFIYKKKAPDNSIKRNFNPRPANLQLSLKQGSVVAGRVGSNEEVVAKAPRALTQEEAFTVADNLNSPETLIVKKPSGKRGRKS